jgi:hypothetical protein
MYKDDGVSVGDIERLLSRFRNQSLDFFGALRASTYDNQIRSWIVDEVRGWGGGRGRTAVRATCTPHPLYSPTPRMQVVRGDLPEAEKAGMAELARRLIKKKDLPQFEPVRLTYAMLEAEGERLEQEQEFVNSQRLSEEYLKDCGKQRGPSIIGLQG